MKHLFSFSTPNTRHVFKIEVGISEKLQATLESSGQVEGEKSRKWIHQQLEGLQEGVLKNHKISQDEAISILKSGANVRFSPESESVPNGAQMVLAMQAAMVMLGEEGLSVDGLWGRNSKAALARIQRLHNETFADANIPVDGLPGPKTSKALISLLELERHKEIWEEMSVGLEDAEDDGPRQELDVLLDGEANDQTLRTLLGLLGRYPDLYNESYTYAAKVDLWAHSLVEQEGYKIGYTVPLPGLKGRHVIKDVFIDPVKETIYVYSNGEAVDIYRDYEWVENSTRDASKQVLDEIDDDHDLDLIKNIKGFELKDGKLVIAQTEILAWLNPVKISPEKIGLTAAQMPDFVDYMNNSLAAEQFTRVTERLTSMLDENEPTEAAVDQILDFMHKQQEHFPSEALAEHPVQGWMKSAFEAQGYAIGTKIVVSGQTQTIKDYGIYPEVQALSVRFDNGEKEGFEIVFRGGNWDQEMLVLDASGFDEAESYIRKILKANEVMLTELNGFDYHDGNFRIFQKNRLTKEEIPAAELGLKPAQLRHFAEHMQAKIQQIKKEVTSSE